MGYVHTADSGNGGIKGPLPAFLNPLPVTESAAANGKPAPVSQRTVLVEGEELAELLDTASGDLKYNDVKSAKPADELQRMGGTAWEKKKMLVRYDLRRFTVNTHPALARAMASLLAEGKKGEVMKIMEDSLPAIIREFERTTGRQVVGASIHWDANLPHWNLWHSGLERVLFKKGKGKERMRYRRTAMNLGSSGPGLRAWRRTQLAFERLGRSFCPFTAEQLCKEERKKLESQGRMPGDWTINAAADAVLEELLVNGGFEKQVAEGFEQFVNNEENRYSAGMAGRLAREDREGLAQEIRKLQELADERGVELAKLKADAGMAGRLGQENSEELAEKIQNLQGLADEREVELAKLKADAGIADQQAREDREGLTKEIQDLQELAGKREAELTQFKASAPVNRKIRKLVTDFLAMVAALPHVMATLKHVPVLRELFASLAPLVGVKLDLDPVDMPEAVTPVKVVLGMAKASVEKAADGKKSVQAAPEVAAGPNMEK